MALLSRKAVSKGVAVGVAIAVIVAIIAGVAAWRYSARPALTTTSTITTPSPTTSATKTTVTSTKTSVTITSTSTSSTTSSTTSTTSTSSTTSATPTTPATTTSGKKTYVIYASLSEMTTCDPSTEFSNSILWMALVYEPLLWYDPIHDKFIPALAVNYTVSKNGTVWTFHLRKGATFHDGTPVTSYAVKFSIERTIKLGQGAAFIWAPVKKILTPNKYTVVFVLKYPAPLNKIVASSYGAWIFSPKVVQLAHAKSATDKKVAEWFNAGHDDGSGPYILVKWAPQSEVVLVKNKNWWGWKVKNYPLASKSAPDVFIIKIVKDAVTQERMVESGDISIAEDVPLEDIPMLKKNPALQVVETPSFQNLIMLINTRKPPLNNVLVRRAIAHAIPYKDIVKVARNGLAEVASGPVPHGMWGHFDNLTYTYNLTLAKELLAKAGYPHGIKRPLILTYTAGDVYEQRTAELIKASLAKIGITVKIEPLSWDQQWSLAQSGWKNPKAAQDLFIFYWWPTYITPFDFLYNMFDNASKSFDLCYYANPTYNKLITEAHYYEGFNKAKALHLYYEAEYILYKDVPAIPLWDMINVVVARSNIGNLRNAINPAYPTVIFAQALQVKGSG